MTLNLNAEMPSREYTIVGRAARLVVVLWSMITLNSFLGRVSGLVDTLLHLAEILLHIVES